MCRCKERLKMELAVDKVDGDWQCCYRRFKPCPLRDSFFELFAVATVIRSHEVNLYNSK
jgi:hypothetical protein